MTDIDTCIAYIFGLFFFVLFNFCRDLVGYLWLLHLQLNQLQL